MLRALGSAHLLEEGLTAMNAMALLRTMHSETKFRLKGILGSDQPAEAQQAWQALRPLLELHEKLEDEYVYTALAEEFGAGSPLGDWAQRHDGDVAIVAQLIAEVDAAQPGTPEWRMALGRVADALTRHVTDEEGQIFGRIEQTWDAARLESIGAEMQQVVDGAAAQQPVSRRAHAASARRRR
ncbi:MAG: hemerythrin domain-containing protein [Chloroflexi bacterium]|nr:hemerythrin domain-containing protein [Chloroflexota bacterium]